MSLSAQVGDFLRRHGFLDSAGVLAVSGGPDSVALVHLLIEHMPSDRLTIAHVNHQLRGDESDEDERFVTQLAAHLGVACRTTRIDVAALAAQERDNLESVARRERYAWLAKIAHEAGADWVATGHTADDQAETVLFRLLRGSGITGMCGMAETRPLDNGVPLVRPLLMLRRPSIHDYLKDRGNAFRFDSSNLDRSLTRNRLRLELLPWLEQHYNPGIVDVLCRLAEQAQERAAEIEVDVVQLLKECELPRAGAVLVFAAERMQQAPANLLREMFRHVWQREHWPMGDMDFTRWQRLVEVVSGHRAAKNFPGGVRVQRVGKVLQIHAPAGSLQ